MAVEHGNGSQRGKRGTAKERSGELEADNESRRGGSGVVRGARWKEERGRRKDTKMLAVWR